MKHTEKAEGLFMKGFNCSQSVFAAFSDVIGMDEDAMLKVSSSFGGGMGGMRDKCGALCGMFMVMGCIYGGYDVNDKAAKTAFYKELQTLAADFERICGSTVCRELLCLAKGVNPPPSDRTEAYYKARPCIRLVSTAVGLLDEYIEKHPI